jgi:hypothetical protein
VVITIGDIIPPTITLNGDNPMVLACCGGVYEDPGVVVSDICDTNPDLMINNGVDTSTPGEYLVTYTATDAGGNVSEITRTVIVQTPQESLTDLIGGVEILVSEGILNSGQGNSLIVKLAGAIEKLDTGQTDAALGMLGACINEITDFIANGLLTPAEGEPLIFGIQAVIDHLTDGEGGAKIATVPEGYSLSQATPNPFNASTQITFQLGQADAVHLVVYNLAGQPIRTLVDGYRSAGIYQVTWDGRGDAGRSVASGLYLYRLQAGSFAQVKRVTLLK